MMGQLRSLRRVSLLVALLCLIMGCGPRSPARLDPQKPPRPGTPEQSITVSRSALQRSLSQRLYNDQLRIVQVYRRNEEFANIAPEYRLFQVHPQSAYALLGLQEADVLVAASGYIIQTPELFREYVRLLPQEQNAMIEVRRLADPLVLRYVFKE